VPRDASIGSSRQQGPSVPSSESSERVDEVRVGAVTSRPLTCVGHLPVRYVIANSLLMCCY
jgi:hypothetical protein